MEAWVKMVKENVRMLAGIVAFIGVAFLAVLLFNPPWKKSCEEQRMEYVRLQAESSIPPPEFVVVNKECRQQ